MTADPPPKKAAGIWLRLMLSVVLGAGFAAALSSRLDTVPDDLTVPGWVIPAYLAALVPYHLLRAGRWHVLLRPLAPLSLRQSTLVGLAGYMWIALLPFRLGEFARPLFLAQRAPVRVSSVLGAVAIERVVDGLTICGLFFVATALAGWPENANTLFWVSLGVMAAFATALAGLAAVARYPTSIGALVHRVVHRLSPKLATRVGDTTTGVAQGLAALPSIKPLVAFAGITVLYWLSNAVGMWILARGCGLALNPIQAMALLAVMNIALLIPGGPAQFGIFQGGVLLGLSLFLDPEAVRDQSSRFVFFLYICQLGTIMLAGLWAQWRLRLDWRAVFGLARPPTSAGDGGA